MEINTGANSTYKKLAVKCSADTFVVNGNLVLRNYICADRRQLLVAAKRCTQLLDKHQIIKIDKHHYG
jgi:hypothetical protein